MSTTTRRTDCHRPGAIVPRDYSLVLHYNLGTTEAGWPVPSFGVNCELDRRVTDATGAITRNGEHDPDGQCCMIGLLHVAHETFAATGATGKCSICGAHFVHGCVWRHDPSGVLINVGHDCAEKYEMVADRADWSAALACAKQRRAALIEQFMRDAREESYYRTDPSMRGVLAVDHAILADMRQKVRTWGSLSEKQTAFAVRLASEAWTPAAPPPVVKPGHHLGTPGKRETFTGTLSRVIRFGGKWDGDEVRYLWIFEIDGAELCWFTGTPPCNRPTERDAGEGRIFGGPIPVTVKATVDKHGERAGVAQTTAKRCAVKWAAGLPATWEAHWTMVREERHAAWEREHPAAVATA